MDIVHIIPNLKNGGAENVLVNLVLKINNRGINQCIYTLNGSNNDFNYNKVNGVIDVQQLEKDSSNLVRLLQKNNKSIVICWMYKSIYLYEKLSNKFKLQNKYYWNIRHSDFGPFQLKQKFFLALMGLYSNFSNCNLIYCSEKSKNTHENYFFKKNSSIVIPNRLAKAMPENFKRPFKKNYLLFIGRMHAQKNPKFLKKIYELINSRFPGFQIIILGRGWDKDFFNSDSNNLVIHDQKENIFDYLKYASCLLFTSRFGEGYPNVIAEAMAVGTPIVGFDSGDYKIMTKNYKLAKIVSGEDEFIKELEIIIKTKPKLSKIDHKKISKELNFDLTVDDYIKLI